MNLQRTMRLASNEVKCFGEGGARVSASPSPLAMPWPGHTMASTAGDGLPGDVGDDLSLFAGDLGSLQGIIVADYRKNLRGAKRLSIVVDDRRIGNAYDIVVAPKDAAEPLVANTDDDEVPWPVPGQPVHQVVALLECSTGYSSAR